MCTTNKIKIIVLGKKCFYCCYFGGSTAGSFLHRNTWTVNILMIVPTICLSCYFGRIKSRSLKVQENLLPCHIASRRRRQKEILRCSFLLSHSSAWRMLYEGSSNVAIITLTGLHYSSFRDLNEKFKLLRWRWFVCWKNKKIEDKLLLVIIDLTLAWAIEEKGEKK